MGSCTGEEGGRGEVDTLGTMHYEAPSELKDEWKDSMEAALMAPMVWYIGRHIEGVEPSVQSHFLLHRHSVAWAQGRVVATVGQPGCW